MSHFLLLVATELPKEVQPSFEGISGSTEDPEKQPQLQQSSSYNCMEYLAYALVGNRLEPYYEHTENPTHLAFYSAPKETRTIYETECIDCVKMQNGRIIPYYYPEFDELYELHDGKVYKRIYGPLYHRKRTAKSKKIVPLPNYPFKKLYPSYDIFMTGYYGCTRNAKTGEYGLYGNPYAKWDWFQIGGRWPLRFLVKEDCPLVVNGEPSLLFKEPPKRKAPAGYHWVSGARKCDIAWDLMHEDALAHCTEHFQEYASWVQKGEIPQEKAGRFKLLEDGITSWGDYVFHRGETLETYLDRMGVAAHYQYVFGTYAFLDEDGWTSSKDTDASGTNFNECTWNQMVSDFIAKQPDETMLVAVDCHI